MRQQIGLVIMRPSQCFAKIASGDLADDHFERADAYGAAVPACLDMKMRDPCSAPYTEIFHVDPRVIVTMAHNSKTRPVVQPVHQCTSAQPAKSRAEIKQIKDNVRS